MAGRRKYNPSATDAAGDRDDADGLDRLVRRDGIASPRPEDGHPAACPREMLTSPLSGGTDVIDASTDLPVGLAGRVPYLGTLTARLTRVRYPNDPSAK